MQELAPAQGVRMGVLFVPSKENVLLDFADPSDSAFDSLQKAVSQERALVARLDRFLGRLGVPTAYARDCRRKRTEEQLYPRDNNGHPLALGLAATRKRP